MASGNVQCPDCGRFVPYDPEKACDLRTDYINFKYFPNYFQCEHCGHVHEKGKFEP